MLIECKGILDFEVDDLTKKHKSQSVWKRTAIIKTDCDMSVYYSWFIKKRFNLELNRPIRKPHISFISDRMDKDVFLEASKLFHGKEITFTYDTSPRTNGKHWWLRIECPEANSIREACGLSRDPFYKFHLTIGYSNERNLEHSEYILRQIKRFGL